MDNYGFIRDKLDIKILILYVLNRLPRPVDITTLSELVFCDDGINYFDYMDALAELVNSGHTALLDDKFFITAKGVRNSEEMESTLPFTVRMKAGKAAERTARMLNRSAMVRASHEKKPDGNCNVSLGLSDSLGNILTLEILAGSEEQAREMEEKFRSRAEDLYMRIANMLLE